MRLCIDLTEIMGLDCTNPLVRVTAEQWLECYEKWPEHCVGSYDLALEAVEAYEPPPASAPAPYSIDLCAILDLNAASTDTIVSKDQWERIQARHPDHCYGGASKSVEERNARSARRAEQVKERQAAKPKELPAPRPSAQEEKPLQPLSSYPLKIQDAFRSKVLDRLAPALLKFFYGVGAIPSESSYHPLSYTKHLFSFDEIDEFFDDHPILFPKIEIQEGDISQLEDDFSGYRVSPETIKDYYTLAVNVGQVPDNWIVEGENLKVVGGRFSEKYRADLLDKITYIHKREGAISLLSDEDFVDDLLRNKPDLIPMWNKCFLETYGNTTFSTTPQDLAKKQSAFLRNPNTNKWEPAA